MDDVIEKLHLCVLHAKPQDRHDAITVCLHAVALSSGLETQGATTLAKDWCKEDVVSIEYTDSKKTKVHLKTLKMGQSLLAHVQVGDSAQVQTIEFTVDDYILKEPVFDDADRMYTLKISQCIAKFKTFLAEIKPSTPPQPLSNQPRLDEQRKDPLRDYGPRTDVPPQHRMPGAFGGARFDPDLGYVDPHQPGHFGAVPSGGMIMDPRSLLRPRVGLPPHGMPGVVPGARFDPMGPMNPDLEPDFSEPRQPGRFGGPNPDGFGPPGFEDDHSMFG